MTAFETIKDTVGIIEVACHYGVEVDRKGKALCFIHCEKTPSLMFKNNRFHCFGCCADGDVIDFVAAVRGISILEAAKELDGQYGLQLFDNNPGRDEAFRMVHQNEREKRRLQSFGEWERQACIILASYCKMLRKYIDGFEQAYGSIEIYALALAELNYIEYLYTSVFIEGGFEDYVEFYRTHAYEIGALNEFFNENGEIEDA